jgi:diguanylate cyclase (GGDEF)-like protein
LLAELMRRHFGRDGEESAGTQALSDFIASLDDLLASNERERSALELALDDARADLAAGGDTLRDSEKSHRDLFELLQATLEATGDAILVIDLDGRVTSCNRRFLELWNVDASLVNDARARNVAVRLLEQIADPEPYSRAVATVLADPAAEHSGLMNLVDGRVIEHSSRPQRLGEEIVGRVWCFRDVTERVVLEQQLAHQAYHDALTGLANRGRFQQRCEEALDRCAHTPEQVGILLIDLDGFKFINDSLGHPAGDALLVQVAHRLLNATRGCDTVARIGGDEFAVLIEGVRTNRDVVVVAERILGSMRAPFFFGESPALIGASVGIARGDSLEITPPVDVPALQPSWQAPHAQERATKSPMRFSNLLRNADLALYHAKSQGKARLALFEPRLYSAAAERLSLERALHAAMDRGEFHLVYQPIVDLREQALVGVEALLRWQHPEFGNIPPEKFIHVAEETGLILALSPPCGARGRS